MQEYFGDLEIPVVAGFKIGHETTNIAIPLGVDAILDAQEKSASNFTRRLLSV